MKCNKCNGEWMPPADCSLNRCPFCGETLVLPTEVDNSIPCEVLRNIVEDFGMNVLKENRLSALIGDMMNVEPKIKQMFKFAATKQIGTKLLAIKDYNLSEKSIQIANIKQSFYEENFLQENIAIYVVDSFVYALGWIDKVHVVPVSEPSSTVKRSRDSHPLGRLIEMVKVEGGTFTMGNKDYEESRLLHQVTLDTFYIGKYPVMQSQWQEITGDNPSKFKGERLPVENISWMDAVQFCNALSKLEGYDACYRIDGNKVEWSPSTQGYRLPTEAEWEYAARGGLQNRGYIYAGNDYIETVGWHGNNSEAKTHEVGQKKPNELGLYDMSGNVRNWCWDWYGEYKSDSQTNPIGPETGDKRVFRGGSCLAKPEVCAIVYRDSDSPDIGMCCSGFRLVLTCSPK